MLAESEVPSTTQGAIAALSLSDSSSNEMAIVLKLVSGQELSPEQITVLEEQLVAAAAKEMLTSIPVPGISSFFSFGSSGGDIQATHQEAIELLAKSGIPGYEHRTVNVDGRNIDIWVDASGLAAGDGRPTRYVHDPAEFTGDRRGIDTNARNAIREVVHETVEELNTALEEHGTDAYLERLASLTPDDLSTTEEQTAEASNEAQATHSVASPSPPPSGIAPS